MIDLYIRALREDDLVLSVDEKIFLPSGPQPSLTLPVQPHNVPNRHEHAYKRAEPSTSLLPYFGLKSESAR
jgi:hypothetical protein